MWETVTETTATTAAWMKWVTATETIETIEASLTGLHTITSLLSDLYIICKRFEIDRAKVYFYINFLKNDSRE
jgi:hypothetical protein